MEQDNLAKLYLNNVWNANLSVTGIEGISPLAVAANVIRNCTRLRLSMRIPPTGDPDKAIEMLKKKLTTDVPYNAKVTILKSFGGSGWCQKELEPWLLESIKKAGAEFYEGKQAMSYGEGGSIPFLKELENKYPKTQIVAFGVLGPESNAHAPNEMLNLPYTKKLVGSISHVIAAIGAQQ